MNSIGVPLPVGQAVRVGTALAQGNQLAGSDPLFAKLLQGLADLMPEGCGQQNEAALPQALLALAQQVPNWKEAFQDVFAVAMDDIQNVDTQSGVDGDDKDKGISPAEAVLALLVAISTRLQQVLPDKANPEAGAKRAVEQLKKLIAYDQPALLSAGQQTVDGTEVAAKDLVAKGPTEQETVQSSSSDAAMVALPPEAASEPLPAIQKIGKPLPATTEKHLESVGRAAIPEALQEGTKADNVLQPTTASEEKARQESGHVAGGAPQDENAAASLGEASAKKGAEDAQRGSPHGSAQFRVGEGFALPHRGEAVQQLEVTGNEVARLAHAIVDQIAKRANLLAARGKSGLNIHLEPQELGKVQIQVMVGPDGVSVKLAAEADHTRNLIEASLTRLRSAFEEQGLRVDRFDLDPGFSYAGFSLAQDDAQRQQTAGHNPAGRVYGWETSPEAEDDAVPQMGPGNALVDYRI